MDPNNQPDQSSPQTVLPQTPTPQPTKDVQVLHKASTSKRLSLKIIIGVVIVLLVGGGVGAYVLINNQKASDIPNVTKSSDISAAEAAAAANTAKINNSKAITSAQVAENVAEIYYAELGYYPATTVDLTNGTSESQIPTGITVVPSAATTALNADNGTNHVTWSCLVTCTATKGGKITYWDFATGKISTDVIYLGDATAHSTFVDPAS